MEIKALQDFSKEESSRLSETYLKGYDKEKLTLHAIAKLVEEVGELSEIISKKLGAQRSSKSNDFNQKELEGEVADVLLVLGILAHLTDADIEKALRDKIKYLNDRYEKGMY